DLPREVLITAMEHHQRYFPVVDREGRLLPFFVAVSNTEPKDLEVVRQGNQRVLKARLADARFFFEEDLKVPLEERVEELKGMVFQAQLGTLYEKTLRVKELAGRLAERVAPHAKEAAQRAAYLSKVDLLTEMVGEFPQLQGVMGREYALRSGERPEVAQAIFEHYLPRSAGDTLPESDAGALVSVADKIDTVVGCFGVGLVPTGTSDPFALRRQTLGIINIILEKGYRLSLKELIGWASELLRERMEREKVEEQVLEFFRGRYENLLFPEGWGREEVAAVLNVQMDDLVDARRRIEALSRMRPLPEFESMVVAFKRVANIVRGTDYPEEPDPSLFIEEQERELYETFQGVKEEFQRLFEAEDYEGILRLFSRMRPAVDAFFDNVLVMEEDKRLRQNRLSLLGKINDLFMKIADFSVLT
ncbi:MAG: glycine--tRNA ligase subunit beta, partial [Deltaproteobacteria bacterium]